METQDHKKPNHSGHDGHGGVHLCHKCGWPYPNPHPSSKIRRAHKKVCGTIDKYRLDSDAQEKTHVEGYDGEPQSDDEFETPSDKGMKKTISRRSSSGVGSRSSRSTRSEDEVFTDAVTEFNESPAMEASGGVIQRFYSMQNENEVDDTVPAEENPIAGADNLRTTDLFKDNLLQAVENVEGEKDKVEVGMASQDHISTKPSLVSAVVTSHIENAVDQNIELSSEPSSELDIVSERGKEIVSSKDESELRTSYSETPVEVADVCNLKGVCDEAQGASGEHLASVSAGGGLIKTSLMVVDGVEDNNERFDVPDSSEREKNGSSIEADSPGNFYSPEHQGEAMNSGNGNISKSELVEGHDSKIDSNESVYALLGSDVLPLEQLPEIEVEDLDHIRGRNSISEAANSTAGTVEYSKGCSVVEGDSNIVSTKTTDGGEVFSEDVSVCSLEDKPEESQKYVDEPKTFGEPDHTSDADSSNADVNIFKSEGVEDLKSENPEDKEDGNTEEKKPVTSLENIFSKGDTMDAGETTTKADSTRRNVEDDGENLTVMNNVGSKVPEDDLAVRNSAFIKPTLDEVTVQDLENVHLSNGMSNENIMVEGAILIGNGISDEATPDIIADHDKLVSVLDSGDLMVGHSLGESLFTSHSGKSACMEEFIVDNGTDSTLKTDNLKTDDHLNSTLKMEVDADAESSDQSSAAVNHCSIEKFAEDTSCITEGDRVIKQQVTITVIDTIVDSGSLADSLDGNWGSVSVMSTTSDAIPTADTIASNHPRSLEGGETPSIVPKPVMENQHPQNQISVKPEIRIQQLEIASEIHPSTEPNRGKKDKEIIEKVANWDSGKQNTPLKTLLGEATARSRAESPIHHNQSSTSTSVPQTDVISGTNNGFSSKTENVMLNSDHPDMETAQEEMGKEWNSPARYPVNIKTEKRRSKSRTYWAPFLCCSSVNAR